MFATNTIILSGVSLTTCPISGESRAFTPLLKYLPDVKVVLIAVILTETVVLIYFEIRWIN
jgi:hypothetical protein